ncbi:hypothetical protein PR202_gb25614 [Eleusine coracana subsp. coracana]|uniref:Uncharacterized protein n=1 Tax=Eleusine coracana subsp. coracana TaxID=191504 RepID=A0AAV5FPD9_ELECO|nr:hypothetical protein PR202_gb25614 [Eleusine coracana subsp. coracana]
MAASTAALTSGSMVSLCSGDKVNRALLAACPASSPASGMGYPDDDLDEEDTLTFRIRPWLLWCRRGPLGSYGAASSRGS